MSRLSKFDTIEVNTIYGTTNVDIQSTSASGLVRILDNADAPVFSYNNSTDVFTFSDTVTIDIGNKLEVNTIDTYNSIFGVTVENVQINNGSIGSTLARVTKGWFDDIESTNYPTVGGTAIADQTLRTTDGVSFNQVSLNDSRKILLGTGDDASIYYDGTDLIVDPKEVGTGIFDVQGDISSETGILRLLETTTPSATTNYGKVYTKNDNFLYFQDGGGTEHTLGFSSNDGLELVGTTVISNDSEIVFTGLDDGYNHLFLLKHITVVTDDVELRSQISRDGGSSYITSGYKYSVRYTTSGGTTGTENSNSTSLILYTSNGAGLKIGNAAGETFSGEAVCFDPSNTTDYKVINFTNGYNNSGANSSITNVRGSASVADAVSAYDAIRFYASSGNLDTGEIEHYIYKG